MLDLLALVVEGSQSVVLHVQGGVGCSGDVLDFIVLVQPLLVQVKHLVPA